MQGEEEGEAQDEEGMLEVLEKEKVEEKLTREQKYLKKMRKNLHVNSLVEKFMLNLVSLSFPSQSCLLIFPTMGR